MWSSSSNATIMSRPRRLPPAPEPKAPMSVAQRYDSLISRLKEEGGRRVPVYLDGEAARALDVVMATDGYTSSTGALRGLVMARARVIQRRG